MLGKYGLDINDPQETHVLRALPERTFSARELVRFYLTVIYSISSGDGNCRLHAPYRHRRAPSGLQRTARELARDARALQKAALHLRLAGRRRDCKERRLRGRFVLYSPSPIKKEIALIKNRICRFQSPETNCHPLS